MQRIPTVLFDFDDTLSDPIPFFLQFAREVGAHLNRRFGGDASEWERAAADMLVVVQDDYWERFRDNPTNGYLGWLDALRVRSIKMLLEPMGRPVPPDAAALSLEMQFEALSRCHAGFPGVTPVVKELAELGYPLHMASGQESEYLRGGLTGLGITPFFGRLFGPDLIDCAKEGTEYYRRVFAALNVQSEHVIVVDDYPPAISWAVQCGAHVIQAKLSPIKHEPTQPGIKAVITDLHDLPHVIQQIEHDMKVV